ncbi:MAG: restriction endonuclease [Rhodobacteraceae bacterium]|nr:restriction endonuclease [Paracoccaceae bacterium]
MDKFAGLHQEELAKIHRNLAPDRAREESYLECKDRLRELVLGSYIHFNNYADDEEFLQLLFRRGLPKAAKRVDKINKGQAQIYEKELERLREAIGRHRVVLYAKARRALKFDDYGNIRNDERRAVFDEFLESQKIAKGLGSWSVRDRLFTYFKREFNRFEKKRNESSAPPLEEADRSGLGFEAWTSEALKRQGWSVVLTATSGDQGVDLIAQKDGLRVAVQCKRYSGSVGNKAVQEVYAGMKHLELDHAVVISTGNFTKSAIVLAATTGVLLQSERDVPHLFELLKHRNTL